MKNKYFGDVHDFHKYGLLQFLQGGKSAGWSWSICVNWMRTEFEPKKGNKDGGKRNYDNLKDYAPDIFEKLKPYNHPHAKRDVAEFPKLDILSRKTKFYTDCVPDADYETKHNIKIREARKRWFDDFTDEATGYDLVFFDPDNGIEVKSMNYGTKYSYKYIYSKEIAKVYNRGQNVLIYQHIPPFQPRSWKDPRSREQLDEFAAIKIAMLKKP